MPKHTYKQVATQTCLASAFAKDNNIPVGNVLAVVLRSARIRTRPLSGATLPIMVGSSH
jgi:hypothetical protein